MGFKLEGFGSEADFARAMKRATRKVAEKALPLAQENAPVDSGNLRDSGEVNDANSPRLGLAETSVDFTADYASHVENGHYNVRSESYIAGQFFLRDTLSELENDLDDEAKRELLLLGAKKVRRTSF